MKHHVILTTKYPCSFFSCKCIHFSLPWRTRRNLSWIKTIFPPRAGKRSGG